MWIQAWETEKGRWRRGGGERDAGMESAGRLEIEEERGSPLIFGRSER